MTEIRLRKWFSHYYEDLDLSLDESVLRALLNVIRERPEATGKELYKWIEVVYPEVSGEI
jgi:hypothetical protein